MTCSIIHQWNDIEFACIDFVDKIYMLNLHMAGVSYTWVDRLIYIPGPEQSQLVHFQSLRGGGQGQRDAMASDVQPRAFGTRKVVPQGS